MSDDPLPKRQDDVPGHPATDAARAKMRGPRAPRVLRIPALDDFSFNVSTGLFWHRPSGSMWLGSRVDRRCVAVEVDGKFIAPSEWLKRQAKS
jgi:hypothetical protein